MGVYIKGLKMPKSCSDCLFFVDGLYDANDELCSACLAKEDNSPSGCSYKEIDGIDHMARRMDYCPLVEVPEPHGRLIDALLKCGDWYTGQGNEEAKRGVNQCIGIVHDLPSAQLDPYREDDAK